jgi:hypothetical protein
MPSAGYFTETVQQFKKLGLDAQMVKTKGEGGVEGNGEIVARLIRETYARCVDHKHDKNGANFSTNSSPKPVRPAVRVSCGGNRME